MARRIKRPKEPKGPKFSQAPEVQELAKKLIEDHHSHLVEARIVYLFRNGKWMKKGHAQFGQAKLAAEDARFIANYDFIVIVNLEAWNNAGSATRDAPVDHELTHCNCELDRAGNKRWTIADHDVHEFISIVRRHGPWEADLQRLMKATKEGPFVQGAHNEVSMFEQGDDNANDKAENENDAADSDNVTEVSDNGNANIDNENGNPAA